MPDAQASLDKLRQLIASHPDALEGSAGSGDVKTAATALSRFATSKGLNLSPDEIESVFQAQGAVDEAQPLDDAALDRVAGGGSPYCIMTSGCYCILTGKI